MAVEIILLGAVLVIISFVLLVLETHTKARPSAKADDRLSPV